MQQPEPSSWTIHLAARHPWRAIITVLLIVFALFAVAAIGKSPVITILAAVLLFGSVAEYLLPITYTLDVDGIHVRQLFSHRNLQWTQVRRVYLRQNGIKLSPLATQSWIDNYRSIFLRTVNQDATLADIQSWQSYTGTTAEFVKE